jgi:hypothetical protein
LLTLQARGRLFATGLGIDDSGWVAWSPQPGLGQSFAAWDDRHRASRVMQQGVSDGIEVGVLHGVAP